MLANKTHILSALKLCSFLLFFPQSRPQSAWDEVAPSFFLSFLARKNMYAAKLKTFPELHRCTSSSSMCVKSYVETQSFM